MVITSYCFYSSCCVGEKNKPLCWLLPVFQRLPKVHWVLIVHWLGARLYLCCPYFWRSLFPWWATYSSVSLPNSGSRNPLNQWNSCWLLSAVMMVNIEANWAHSDLSIERMCWSAGTANGDAAQGQKQPVRSGLLMIMLKISGHGFCDNLAEVRTCSILLYGCGRPLRSRLHPSQQRKFSTYLQMRWTNIHRLWAIPQECRISVQKFVSVLCLKQKNTTSLYLDTMCPPVAQHRSALRRVFPNESRGACWPSSIMLHITFVCIKLKVSICLSLWAGCTQTYLYTQHMLICANKSESVAFQSITPAAAL